MSNAGNVRRTIYLTREADAVVREQASRRQMDLSEVINEAILGGPVSAPGECWKMPEAPIGSSYVPSVILPRHGYACDDGYAD